MPLNNQTIPGMDGVLSAHREGLRGKSALLGPLWSSCKLRAGVLGTRGWAGEGRVSERGRAIQGLFLSHQSWYLRARARPGTMPKARRKESLEFTQRTEPSPPQPSSFSSSFFLPLPSNLNGYSSGNNIRASDVIVEQRER